MVINGDLSGRDFTGGEATALFARVLSNGVRVFCRWEETLACLERDPIRCLRQQ